MTLYLYSAEMKDPHLFPSHVPTSAVVPHVLVALKQSDNSISKFNIIKSVFAGLEASNLVFKEVSTVIETHRALLSTIYDLVVVDENLIFEAPQLLLVIKEVGVPILFLKQSKTSTLEINDIEGYQESYWSDRRTVIRGVRRSLRNALQHALTYGVERDRLISRVLSLFIDAEQLDLTQVLPAALEEIGKFTGVDRVFVWNFHLDGSVMSKSYQWARPGVRFHFGVGQEIPINIYAWVVSKIKLGEIVNFNSCSELPQEASSDLDTFKLADTLSYLGVPLISKGIVTGIIGFSSVSKEREWGARTTDLATTFGRIIVSAMEIHRAQQALVSFEDYFGNIAENLNEGLIIANSSGLVEHVNSSALQILGMESDQAISSDIKALLGETAWKAVLDSANSKKDSNSTLEQPIEFCNRKNESRWLRFNAASMAGDQSLGVNFFNKFIVLIADVSAQCKIEDQFRHSRSMEALGRVVGGVAHDFNNLLTAVLGYTGLLLNKIPEESPYKFELTQVKKASEQAASLVNQLLTFSRKQVLTPKVIDVNEVVSETTKMLRRLIGEDIDLRLDLAQDLPHSKLDQLQLQQIILNLAVNARDAMPEGGILKISTRILPSLEGYSLGEGNYIEIIVQDSGTGIPDDVLPNIFEPFFTTKELGKGTGLGLSTVYGAVKQNGGDILVETPINAGTTFRIAFPTSREFRTQPEIDLKPEKFRNGTETVLLVEDDQPVRALIKQVLNAQGYKVLEAVNGKEAVRIIKSYPYKIQLLVTDVVMPELGGSRVIEQFLKTRSESKILIVSGYVPEKSLAEIISEPSCLFLPKPFTAESLLTTVDCLLDQGQSLNPSELFGENSQNLLGLKY